MSTGTAEITVKYLEDLVSGDPTCECFISGVVCGNPAVARIRKVCPGPCRKFFFICAWCLRATKDGNVGCSHCPRLSYDVLWSIA